MAQFYSLMEQFPVEEQIKSLDDEELLDFWEETQYLEKFLEDELSASLEYGLEYERMILQELQVRTCLRTFIRK